MELDHLSLTLPVADRGAISLRKGTIRSVDRSSQLLVIEVPADALEGTDLTDQAGIEAGASIMIRTATGRTYEGYVEVIAESDIGRVYWCGVISDSEKAARMGEVGEI